MRLLVLVNPGAARAEALEEIAAWFRQNCEVTFVTTSSEDHLAQVLLRHGHKADRIVIGGGDGTISKALPELLALGKPLAVLPLGTANDFARCLGLPHDKIAAAQIALHGRAHRVDVGLVNGKPFLNVASVGVAAQVSQAQSQGLKRTWRLLSYAIGLLRVAGRSRPFSVDLTIDGAFAWSGWTYQVGVGNGRYHGGGLTVAEHAAIDDGQTPCLFRPARYVLAACRVRHPPQIRSYQAGRLASAQWSSRDDPHPKAAAGQRRWRDQHQHPRRDHVASQGPYGDGSTDARRRSGPCRQRTWFGHPNLILVPAKRVKGRRGIEQYNAVFFASSALLVSRAALVVLHPDKSRL